MNLIGKVIGGIREAGLARTPVPSSHLRSLEVALQGGMPLDYMVILEKCGRFCLPRDPKITFHDPAAICAIVASMYNMEGLAPWDWPAVPIGHLATHGDSFGYLRHALEFGPELVILDHEGPWTRENDFWHKPLSPSLSDMVLNRLHTEAHGT